MVHELLDKGVIALLCLLLVIIYEPGIYFVLALLMALIIVLICYLEKVPDIVQYILIIIYALSIFEFPVSVAFIPLIVYDVVRKKMRYGACTIAVVYMISVFMQTKGMGVSDNFDAIMLLRGNICAGIFTIVSIVLCYRTMAWQKTELQMRKLRDDSIEKNNLLENRNIELIERQNIEINMATLKERNRIAREIHDNVGHMLTRAILQTGALGVIAKDEVVKEQLAGLSDTLNTAMDNIRSSVHDLHDESVDMCKAVEDVIARFPGLEVTLSYDVQSSVSTDMKYSFISIVKEALNNTSKHSNGNKVRIMIAEHPGFYQLVISDNGTDIPDNYVGGMGMSSIRERVRALKGNFNINTDNGFRISVSVMK